MDVSILFFSNTKLIGKKLTFTYADYSAFELWSNFMPRLKEIKNVVGTDLYNIQINPDNFDFNPNTPFVKWAAIAVSSFDFIPADMEILEISEGLYAVFNYKGNQSNAAAFFNLIYTEWLPKSDFELDNRPHFEILGTKYKNNAHDSEEEIWIPIKRKV